MALEPLNHKTQRYEGPPSSNMTGLLHPIAQMANSIFMLMAVAVLYAR